MALPSIANQGRPILKDCTIMTLSNLPAAGGAAGTPIAYLGDVESVEFDVKREYVSTTASADPAESSRAVRWGKGSVKLTGFSAAVGSKFAAMFAQGGHALLQFTETATGESWAFNCTCESYSKSLGKEANKDSLTLGIEGVPFYAAGGGTPVALTLE